MYSVNSTLCELIRDAPYETLFLPVFNLPIRNPSLSSVFAKPMLGSSFNLPAGLFSNPMFIWPFRKVPVVITTASPNIFVPSSINVPFKIDHILIILLKLKNLIFFLYFITFY